MKIAHVLFGAIGLLSSVFAVDTSASAGSDSFAWVKANIQEFTAEARSDGLPKAVDFSVIFGTSIETQKVRMTTRAFEYLILSHFSKGADFDRVSSLLNGAMQQQAVDSGTDGRSICAGLWSKVSDKHADLSAIDGEGTPQVVASRVDDGSIASGIKLEKIEGFNQIDHRQMNGALSFTSVLEVLLERLANPAIADEIRNVRLCVEISSKLSDIRYQYSASFDAQLAKTVLVDGGAVLLRVTISDVDQVKDVGNYCTMLLLGYNDVAKTYQVLRPLSKRFGDHGFGVISYDDLPVRVSETWFVTFNQAPSSSWFRTMFGY